MSEDDNKVAPAALPARKATAAERAELELAYERTRKEVRRLIAIAEREARAAGKSGDGVHVGRGWVVHPDDRGALKRKRRRR